MEKPEFDDYFKTLDKAGDRVRSVLYVFIVINIALLMYGVNVFTYPAQQYVFDEINLQVRCRYHPAKPECDKVKAALERVDQAPRLDDKIEQPFWNHQLNLFYDNSVALRTFKAPILGLETDRDLLWLIFPLIGIVSYFIVWSALVPLAGIFRFLLDRNRSDPVRLRLMQSVPVISAPLNHERGGEITSFYRVLWQVIAVIVFAIPPLVILLMVADQTNFVPAFIYHVPGEHFLAEPTRQLQVKLAFEIAMLLLQFGLFYKIVRLGLRFGLDLGEAQTLVTRLEGRAGPSTTQRPVRARWWRQDIL